MRPVRLTLTIELPPDGTAERDQLMHMTLAELLGFEWPPSAPQQHAPALPPAAPPVRPHREPGDDDEPDEAPRPRGADGVPADGRQLLGWLKSRGRDEQRKAVSLAKSRGYGTLLLKLTADQAADLYHELTAAGPGPAPAWGGRRAR